MNEFHTSSQNIIVFITIIYNSFAFNTALQLSELCPKYLLQPISIIVIYFGTSKINILQSKRVYEAAISYFFLSFCKNFIFL